MERCALHDAKSICCPNCQLRVCGFCSHSHVKKSIDDVVCAFTKWQTSLPEDEMMVALFYLDVAKHMIILSMKSLLCQYDFNYKIIHTVRESNLSIFHPLYYTKTSITLDIKINNEACSISNDYKIYFIGGDLTSSVYQYNTNKSLLAQKASMISPRYRHALCIHRKFIYSLGGYDECKFLSQCEAYSIYQNKWSPIPPLNIPRRESAAVAHNNIYIYCICGCGTKRLKSIERLSIYKCVGWEIVSFDLPFTPRSCIAALQINLSQVIIIGGVGDNWEGLMDCYCLKIEGDNPAHYSCEQIASLKSKSAFYSTSNPEYMHGNIYCLDNAKRLHVFAHNQWRMKYI